MKKLIHLIVSVGICANIYAMDQTIKEKIKPTDEIKKNYVLGNKYKESNYSLAEEHFTIAINLLGKFKDMESNTLKALTNLELAVLHALYSKNYKKAENHYKEAIKLSQLVNHMELESSAINGLGKLYLVNLNKFDKAIKYFKKNIALAKKTKNKKIISLAASAHLNISLIYRRSNDYEAAKINLLEALKMTMSSRDKQLEQVIHEELSFVYKDLQDYEKSNKHKSESEKLLKKQILQPAESKWTIKKRKMLNLELNDKKTCNVCKKKGKMKKCSRCRSTYYCSRECQVKDWEEHKKVCKKKDKQ